MHVHSLTTSATTPTSEWLVLCGHLEGAVAPNLATYSSCAASLHALMPATFWNLPGSHWRHASVYVGAYSPAGQPSY